MHVVVDELFWRGDGRNRSAVYAELGDAGLQAGPGDRTGQDDSLGRGGGTERAKRLDEIAVDTHKLVAVALYSTSGRQLPQGV